MSGKILWALEEIREAYQEVLTLFNELSHHQERVEREEIFPEGLGPDFEMDTDKFRKGLTEKARELKEAADRSGNAVTWLRGNSLEGLSQELRERIETALTLGI